MAPASSAVKRLGTEVVEVGKVLSVPISRVRRYEGQPRKYFDPADLDDLEASIRERGQRQPADVRIVTDDPDHDYELIAGERRWTVMGPTRLNRTMIDIIIKPVEDEEDQFEQSLTENVARKDLNALEESDAVHKVMEFKKLEWMTKLDRMELIGKKYGKSSSWVKNRLSLYNLIPEVRARMDPRLPEEERMTDTVGVFLSRLSAERQEECLPEIIAKRMGVDAARLYIRKVVADYGEERVNRHQLKGKPSQTRKQIEPFLRNGKLQVYLLNHAETVAALRKNDSSNIATWRNDLKIMIIGLDQLRTSLGEVSMLRRDDRVQSAPKLVQADDPDLYKKVMLALFFSGPHNSKLVNLSKHHLANSLKGVPSAVNAEIEILARRVVVYAGNKWRVPVRGTEDEQTFIRFMHRFRREFGELKAFHEALNFAIGLDKSADPVLTKN